MVLNRSPEAIKLKELRHQTGAVFYPHCYSVWYIPFVIMYHAEQISSSHC